MQTFTPLMCAAEFGHDLVMTMLLDYPTIQVNCTNDHGTSALLVACELGHESTAKILLSVPGIDVNHADNDGDTPLMMAAKSGLDGVVDMLLQRPDIGNIDVCNNRGMTPLMFAAFCNRVNVVKRIVAYPFVDANKSDETGNTALHWACVTNSVDVVDELLQHDTLMTNVQNKEGFTALFLAASNNDVKAIEALLGHHDTSAVNTPEYNGMTPLLYACDAGREALVKALLTCPELNVNSCTGGETALYVACKKGRKNIALCLLGHSDIDTVKPNSVGIQPFDKACATGLAKVVAKMLTCHAVIDAISAQGGFLKTGLHLACQEGHNAVLHVLLNCATIDVNQPDFLGKTPLFISCENGRESIVKQLLRRSSVDVNRTDADYLPEGQWTNRMTPLMIAAKNGHIGVVKILLKGKLNVNSTGDPCVDVNLADKKGNSALMLAAEAGHANVVELLLQSKKCNDINASNEDGHCALYLAYSGNHASVVHVLIKQPHINVTRYDKDSNTILTGAAKFGRHEIIKVLLNRQRRDVLDEEMSKAFNLVIGSGHLEAFKALIQSIDVSDLFRFGDFMIMVDLAMEHQRYNIVHELLSIQETLTDKQKMIYYVALLDGPRHKGGTHFIKCTAKYLTHESAMQLLRLDNPFKFENGRVIDQKHEYSWTTFLDSACEVPLDVRCSCIQAILDEHDSTEWLHALAFAKDKHGRRAIDTADAVTRKYLRGRLYFCGRYELLEGPPVHVSSTAVVVLAFDHEICHQVFHEYAVMGDLDYFGFIKCNQALGRLLERNATHKKQFLKRERDSIIWAKDFDLWDKDKNGTLSESEFVHYCTKYFGSKLKVALKFMRNEVEFKREIKTRNNQAILNSGRSRVLGLLPSPDQIEFKIYAKKLTINGDLYMADYPNVLVMPAADRSLEDIYTKEMPKDTKIKDFLFEVADAVAQLHEVGIVHGDIKTTNIVRVHNQLKLIDLDAAVCTGKEHAGVKFSSGVVPPEMFYKLQNEAEGEMYKTYWKEEASDIKRWNKLKPKHGFVVRTYRPDHIGDLPYSLVEATPAVDMWAYGCLMYRMLCGEELVPTDINHDVVSNQVKSAATWTDGTLATRIENNIPDEWAQLVLKQLLVIDPKKRLSAAKLVETFTDGPDFAPFLGKISKVLDKGETQHQIVAALMMEVEEARRLQAASHLRVMDEVSRLQRIVFDGMMEVHEVVTPTSFVILPLKVCTAESEPSPKSMLSFVNQSMSACNKLKAAYDQVAKMDSLQAIPLATHASAGAILQWLNLESMYLYLIDEGTGKIAVPNEVDAIYPIEIQPNDTTFWVAALPWIESGLSWLEKGLATPDSAIDWLQIHGFLPDYNEADDKMIFREKPKVNVNKTLPTVSVNGKEIPLTLARGRVLQPLKKWFEIKDPAQVFGGLKRVMAKEGRIIWTKEDVNATEILVQENDQATVMGTSAA
ncbi:Aste57867_9704 [Aphanomyces stellatus]|uniref:Aste57867_9704 protein n=1 Tax=Aphanomyces stellatus TaxID=120398 RepID=A0A485KNL8_9STRA|nr:hypothetical protein As57867_009666 [Aphanomyces stellatus]VFT86583.1 Aste57867_9704 [Aphanomyces stellatus]